MLAPVRQAFRPLLRLPHHLPVPAVFLSSDPIPRVASLHTRELTPWQILDGSSVTYHVSSAPSLLPVNPFARSFTLLACRDYCCAAGPVARAFSNRPQPRAAFLADVNRKGKADSPSGSTAVKAATATAPAAVTTERSENLRVPLNHTDLEPGPQAVEADGQEAVKVESAEEAERRIGQGQAQVQEGLPVWSGEGFVGPTQAGEKPRVVVLGSGWAACRFMRDIDTKVYDIACVSPRNHMVFTPLLASTCVGTLEFRSVAEPVEAIQPAVSTSPSSFFFLGKATSIDPVKKQVHCEYIEDESPRNNCPPSRSAPWRFTICFDKLVVATGASASTFGIQGVRDHAFFLREVKDAQAIRRRLLLNLMKSDTPGLPEAEKRRLLSCVVVGGGPTGVEFSGELSDFIRRDVRSKYAHVKDYVSVTLIEAREILSSFDVSLRHYAIKQLFKSGVRLVQGQVQEVRPSSLLLTDGSIIPYGLLVWSTGVGPNEFTQAMPFKKSPGGRIAIDERLRVIGQEDIYSMGDCAGYDESTGKPVLPALAQVAERQGRYLALELNSLGRAGHGRAGSVPAEWEKTYPPFVYRHLGSMATVGRYKALVDLQLTNSGVSLTGFISWLIWRSAYLTRVVSWRNRLYVAVNWATTFLFGRDISRI